MPGKSSPLPAHVPWCMSGSLIRGGGENVRGIPGACAPAIFLIWQDAHGRHWQSTTKVWYGLVVSANGYQIFRFRFWELYEVKSLGMQKVEYKQLIHCGLVMLYLFTGIFFSTLLQEMPYCVMEQRQYLKVWSIFKSSNRQIAPRYKYQWNCNRSWNIFSQWIAFQNIVCKLAAILSRPHCVKWRLIDYM